MGFNVVHIVDNDLNLGTTTTLNANQFNLLVYSLADPPTPSSSATRRSLTSS